jgi:hypothetical protein
MRLVHPAAVDGVHVLEVDANRLQENGCEKVRSRWAQQKEKVNSKWNTTGNREKKSATDLPESGGLVGADAVAAADGDDDGGAQSHVVARVHLREQVVHRLQIQRDAQVLEAAVTKANKARMQPAQLARDNNNKHKPWNGRQQTEQAWMQQQDNRTFQNQWRVPQSSEEATWCAAQSRDGTGVWKHSSLMCEICEKM